MRVLVVEDDRRVASFIQKGLEQEGLAVDVLYDGGDAEVQARMVDYDCVVLDLLLPGRSGFQVLRDLRSKKADLPVLILSAQASPEERVVGLNGGADDYMGKPRSILFRSELMCTSTTLLMLSKWMSQTCSMM
jgi:DNA-binding response OmpR family regulator